MSHFWNCNPELYTEIIFKEMLRRKLVKEEDYENADEIVNNFLSKPDSWRLVIDAESGYWVGRIDEVK